MKYIKQLCIITGFTFLGEILHQLIPFPIPSGIYGIILLFAALMTGIVKPDQIKETAGFLINVMPILFIPSVVGIIDLWSIIKNRWLVYLVVLMLTTVFVMLSAGWVTQLLLKKGPKHE